MENALERYELLVLAVPTITQDETTNLESQVEKIIKEGQGTVIAFDRWGKHKLAYQVEKNDYGIYFLVRFETQNYKDALEQLQSLFAIRLNTIVMRYVITHLAKDVSLEYQRPRSLEEMPPEDVGGLIKGYKRDRGQYPPRERRGYDDRGSYKRQDGPTRFVDNGADEDKGQQQSQDAERV